MVAGATITWRTMPLSPASCSAHRACAQNRARTILLWLRAPPAPPWRGPVHNATARAHSAAGARCGVAWTGITCKRGRDAAPTPATFHYNRAPPAHRRRYGRIPHARLPRGTFAAVALPLHAYLCRAASVAGQTRLTTTAFIQHINLRMHYTAVAVSLQLCWISDIYQARVSPAIRVDRQPAGHLASCSSMILRQHDWTGRQPFRMQRTLTSRISSSSSTCWLTLRATLVWRTFGRGSRRRPRHLARAAAFVVSGRGFWMPPCEHTAPRTRATLPASLAFTNVCFL